jgi:hypothetical protein
MHSLMCMRFIAEPGFYGSSRGGVRRLSLYALNTPESGEDAGDAVGNEAVDGHDNESEGGVTRARGSRQCPGCSPSSWWSIKVYTGILDRIIERLEGRGGYRSHSQGRKVLELAAEQQAQHRGMPASWSRDPQAAGIQEAAASDSDAAKMQVEFLQKIQAGAQGGWHAVEPGR